jgi:lipid-binding SYLF domain-containing protein
MNRNAIHGDSVFALDAGGESSNPFAGRKRMILMLLHRLFTVGLLALSFTAGSAFGDASDKAKKRAEVHGKAKTSLEAFYKADPKLQAEVGKAAGYGVFGTYGLSFLVGGAGGTGLVRDNKTKKDTFMDIAQASAGVQVGASETSYLFVFKDAAAMRRFIDSGWEAGASASAGAGAGDKTVEAGAGAGAFTGGKVYTLTKTGLQAGGAVAGTKVWKSKDLN